MTVALLAVVACVPPSTAPQARVTDPPAAPPLADPPATSDPVPPATGTPATQPVAASSVPVFGGTLLRPAGSPLVFASDPEGDRLVALDVASNEVAWSIGLPVGSRPFRLASNGDMLFASLREAASIAVVDLTSRVVTVAPAGCPEPRGLAWDAGRAELWLACASGELERFDATGALLGSFDVDADLRDVVVLPDAIYVSRMRSAEVLGVDADSGAVLSRRTPAGIDLDRDDGTTESFVPHVAWRLEADSQGTGLVMAHQLESLSTIPSSGETVYGTPPDEGGDPCGSLAPPGVSWFPPGGSASTVALQASPLPVDLAWSEADDAWWIASAGSAGTGLSEVSPAQIAPGCLTPATQPVSRPVAVAFGPAGERVVQTQSPFGLAVNGQPSALGDATPLPPDADTASAFDLFHAETPSGLACASCHAEAQDDGNVWTFAEGPRRTQNLAGGLASTAPYHWDGIFADLDSLLDDVFVTRMGGTPVDERGTAALLAWVDAVRPVASTTHASPDQIAHGAEMFVDVAYGCASCHSGPELTSPGLQYVGTRGEFAVPSLRGVGSRGPWMHDGCATTLADRFLDPNCGGTRHGGLVNPADVDDLVAYLTTL